MAVPQITVRLTPDRKVEFERYAARFGLDASELAKLLIVRERLLQRLPDLLADGRAVLVVRTRAAKRRRLPTVTAHLSTVKAVAEFDAYARRCGMNRSQAGAWILEMELRERWLEHAIRQPSPCPPV